jgi:hypothetical protein
MAELDSSTTKDPSNLRDEEQALEALGQVWRRCRVSRRTRNSASSLISSSFGDKLIMMVKTNVITEIPSTSGSRKDSLLAPGMPGIPPA